MRSAAMRFDSSIKKFINNLAPHEIPEGECKCGCGQPTPMSDQGETKRGYIRNKPHKYAFSHNRGIATTERFYVPDPQTDCWNWQRHISDGYGVAVVTENGKKRNWKAHILYYTLCVGDVPEGLVLDHTCRNTKCVNPEHLEAVSHVDNVRRGKNVKITVEIAKEIRELHAAGKGGYRTIAKLFSISWPQVAKIVKRQSWV